MSTPNRKKKVRVTTKDIDAVFNVDDVFIFDQEAVTKAFDEVYKIIKLNKMKDKEIKKEVETKAEDFISNHKDFPGIGGTPFQLTLNKDWLNDNNAILVIPQQ